MATIKKVLIIDDDTTLCDMYSEELKAKGYQVALAHNGISGLEAAEKEKPDVILLDIMMPKQNGFDTLRKLKENGKTAKIPVIVLSALVQEENKKKASALGASAYLVKSEAMPKDVVSKIASLV